MPNPRRLDLRYASYEATAPRLVPSPVPPLTWMEERAVRHLVDRIRGEVDAVLMQAALFGSRARGDAGPDSDLDVLLVFATLPPDREPQAGQAEAIAADVAEASGVPVAVWSVSLIDLRRGNRTPMLVDALADAIPLWCSGVRIGSVPFTPADAVRCSRALIERVAEGSEEVEAAVLAGDLPHAVRRARDDLVRMCTALLLVRGSTSPRRAEAVRACAMLEFGHRLPAGVSRTLQWAIDSFGREGKDEDREVHPPPGGLREVARVVDVLRERVYIASERLSRRLDGGYPPMGTKVARE